MTDVIQAVHHWRNNSFLIEDVASLGYLSKEWLTLDPTYGYGTWWQRWRPERLVCHDINPAKAPHGVVDFRHLPYADSTFDAVVFDGPYKLNGRPDEDIDERYGIDVPSRWQDRIELLKDGLVECARLVKPKGYLLCKVMDQVVSGKNCWQTMIMTNVAEKQGLRLVDRFDMLGGGRPQPMKGRTQRHAHGRPSTLLIFKK